MDSSKLQDIKLRYGIVGDSDGLNRALDVALQVAPTDLSVLIVGESGVGKEAIPRVIHDCSPRRRENYFAINCGSIPEGTIDSELFGHEKGAFTGAIGEREGYFGAANKGTLFLDEVGELPLSTQARLLRVLETGEYIRVGGTKVMKTDVRIVAATNVNMQKAISEGRFREDLYYRLNTIPVTLPPLRERGNDIVLLFILFAMNMSSKYNLPRLTLTDEAKRILLKYKWPGNIRQLKNVTEQIALLADSPEITAETILRYIPDDPETTALQVVGHGATGHGKHSYDAERELIFKFLYELQGSVNVLRQEVSELRAQIEGKHQKVTHALDDHISHVVREAPTSYVHDADIRSVPMDNAYEDAFIEEITATEVKDHGTERTSENVMHIDAMEKQMIMKALERNGGNRKRAADELGMTERTLYRRLNQYGLK